MVKRNRDLGTLDYLTEKREPSSKSHVEHPYFPGLFLCLSPA